MVKPLPEAPADGIGGMAGPLRPGRRRFSWPGRITRCGPRGWAIHARPLCPVSVQFCVLPFQGRPLTPAIRHASAFEAPRAINRANCSRFAACGNAPGRPRAIAAPEPLGCCNVQPALVGEFAHTQFITAMLTLPASARAGLWRPGQRRQVLQRRNIAWARRLPGVPPGKAGHAGAGRPGRGTHLHLLGAGGLGTNRRPGGHGRRRPGVARRHGGSADGGRCAAMPPAVGRPGLQRDVRAGRRQPQAAGSR